MEPKVGGFDAVACGAPSPHAPQWLMGPYVYELACLPHREIVLAESLYWCVGTIPGDTWNGLAQRLPPYAQGYLRALLGAAPFNYQGSCYWV